jgi:hypothetical protein
MQAGWHCGLGGKNHTKNNSENVHFQFYNYITAVGTWFMITTHMGANSHILIYSLS